MEQIATVYYGCGIHVTDVKFIKPEYHPTISGAWIQALQKLNSHILETSNNVNENYYSIESLYQVTLWSIDQKGKCTEMESENYPGCILPLGKQPKLFGGIGHSYQSVIDTLRNKYGNDEDIQYLEGSHLHRALLHLKETTEFDIEDVGYINYVFNALCNQEIPYLDVKEHQILTDGSVEY